ncbi:MAG: hypothetical protein QNJ84_14340 [Alphaproteobacteria bacterium]|nr:hypothetical protein [Alphaproteobacteria bacterium]
MGLVTAPVLLAVILELPGFVLPFIVFGVYLAVKHAFYASWRLTALGSALIWGLLFWDYPLRQLQYHYICNYLEIDNPITNTEPLDQFYFSKPRAGCDALCQRALIEYGIGEVILESDLPGPDGASEGWVRYALAEPGAVCEPAAHGRCITATPMPEITTREEALNLLGDWDDRQSHSEFLYDLWFPYRVTTTEYSEKSSGLVFIRSVSLDMYTGDRVSAALDRAISGYMGGGRKCKEWSIFDKYPDFYQRKAE